MLLNPAAASFICTLATAIYCAAACAICQHPLHAEQGVVQGVPPEKDAPPGFRIEDSFMWECLGGEEAAQEASSEIRYDQSEAFEYCLQLYQTVSKIQPSKFGHYIV